MNYAIPLARLLVSVVILMSLSCTPQKQHSSISQVTLLYTNDIESVYDPIEAYWNEDINKIGGISYLATKINQVREEESLSFLFDAGDIFTGALSSATGGALPFDIYSAMGYDVMCLGNHEYEYGWQQLNKSRQRARFPVLNANIFYEGTDISFAQQYTILEKEGVRIGVIGIMGIEAFYNTIYKLNRSGLEVRDPIPIVQDLVNKLRPEVDLVVALTHQNKSAPMQSDKEADPAVQRGFDEDYEMAGKIKGLDVIFGGHSDNGLWEPVRHPKTGTLIGLTFGQGKYLGYMNLAIDKSKQTVDLVKGELIPIISEELVPDADVSHLISKARLEHPHMTEVIGQLDKNAHRKYYQESPLASLLTDMMRISSQSDVAMLNPGAIRADLNPGDITVEEIKNIYPFIDNMTVFEASGETLRQILEYSFSLTYGLVQFSGIKISYDPRKPEGNRLVSAMINDVPLDKNKLYSIACSAYIAQGGDGYEMIDDVRIIEDKSNNKLAELLIQYIRKKQNITLPEPGRQIDVSKTIE